MEKKNTNLNGQNLLALPSKNPIINPLGQPKHFPPANKEWTNSVYAYNKTSLRSLAVKDFMAKKLIKSYFNLSIEKTLARSKRMRSRIRKSTVKKLFISKPEIKQTNDKVIVTVYTFDREKQILLRKLYFSLIKWEAYTMIGKKEIKNKKFKTKKQKFRLIRITRKFFGLADLLRFNNLLINKNINKNAIRKNLLAKLSLGKNRKLKTKVKVNSLTNKSLVPICFVPNKPNNLNLAKKPVKRNKFYLTEMSKRTIKSLNINKLKSKSGRLSRKKFGKLFRKRFGRSLKKRSKGKTYFKPIYFKIKRNKKQFKPKKLFYIYKPWLRGTSKLYAFKRYLRKRYKMFNIKRKRIIEKKMPFFGFKHSKQMNLFYFMMNSKKRFLEAKKLLLYFYAVYLLSLLKIKVHSFEETLKINKKKIKKLKKEEYVVLEVEKTKGLVSKKKKVILIKKNVPYYVRRYQQYNLPFNLNKEMQVHFYLKKEKISIVLKNISFNKFIILLLTFVKKIINKNANFNLKSKLKRNFSNYSKKYFLDVFYKSLFYVKNKEKMKINLRKFNKDVLTINSLVKIIVNRFKFGSFLLKLKLLINKIYNKKVELNLVNLKSAHLNTDIFTQAVAIKIKKKVGLLRVMRRSLQLVKLPYDFKTAAEELDVNKLKILNEHRRLNLDNLKKNMLVKSVKGLNQADNLENTLKTLYTRSLINGPKLIKNTQDKLFTLTIGNNNRNTFWSKVTSVLNLLKYKWVTGVRLEAAGRLTRRYTAARSVFKYRSKGSLKNTDYTRKLDFLKKSMPNVILRNLVKSNSQNSFLKSKKRIGAFGLKTWMSSY